VDASHAGARALTTTAAGLMLKKQLEVVLVKSALGKGNTTYMLRCTFAACVRREAMLANAIIMTFCSKGEQI
jgi:hypothetical protein